MDERYRLCVPLDQRKIDVGAAKTYGEGDLEVQVIADQRTEVEISLSGGEPVKVPNPVQTPPVAPDRIRPVICLDLSGKRAVVFARCDPAIDALRAVLHAQETAVAAEVVDPAALVTEATRSGQGNPGPGNARAVGEGQRPCMSNGCDGCHDGTGLGPACSSASGSMAMTTTSRSG